MINYEFWSEWKNITLIEKKAIQAVRVAKKIILETVPKEEIISIYVRGSMIRREMNEKSDVDTNTILKTEKYLDKIKKLDKEIGKSHNPVIGFSAYSINELKTGVYASKEEGRASTSRFVKHLEHYKLVYGEELDSKNFFLRSDKEHLSGMIKNVRKIIELYKNGKIGFSDLLKQVFWLAENEQRCLGKNPPYNWHELERSINNKNHIIHEAIKLRDNPTKDPEVRNGFVERIGIYIDEIESEFQM